MPNFGGEHVHAYMLQGRASQFSRGEGGANQSLGGKRPPEINPDICLAACLHKAST